MKRALLLLLIFGLSSIYSQLLGQSIAPELDPSSNVPEGLSVGDLAPNFVGLYSETEKIDSRKLLRDGPVVVVFYRGVWSPDCRNYLRNLEDSLSTITSCGASVIAVSPESLSEVSKISRAPVDSLYFVSDDVGVIMKAFDVSYLPSRSYLHKIAHYRNVELDKHNGEIGARLPVVSVFVISAGGKVCAVYFDLENDLRPSVAEIQGALQSITR